MNNLFRSSINTLFIVAFLFVAVGCNKPDEIGKEVLPEDDLINSTFTDTTTIETSTLLEDSLRADELTYELLGSYNDPLFGVTDASFYTQILLGATPNFGADTALSADSVVLIFKYSGFYGDTTLPQTVHVYPVTESIYYDSTYYSDRVIGYDASTDLANGYQISPRIKTSSTIRIPLSTTLADSLVHHAGVSSLIAKGVYIKVDPATGTGNGAIMYLDPLDAASAMTLYYKLDTLPKTYNFSFRSAARINHFEHDAASTAFMQVGQPANADTVNYLQSMAGLKVKVNFPYLKNFLDSGNIAINKAELVITAAELPALYPVPSKVFFSAYDADGKLKFVPDYGETVFGGDYYIPGHSYVFSITRQLQQVLDGKVSDYGYSINVLGASVQANRLVIGSGKTGSSSKMKLRLYYTRIK